MKYWKELIHSGLANSCLKGWKIVLCILAKYINSEQVFWGKEEGIFVSIWWDLKQRMKLVGFSQHWMAVCRGSDAAWFENSSQAQ